MLMSFPTWSAWPNATSATGSWRSSAGPARSPTSSTRGNRFRVDDPERLGEREERLGERRRLCSPAHVLPVDLLAQGARPLEHRAVIRLLLGDRHQLRGHDVLER